MSISLCRRISMALVVCICASFCLLPFRAAAGQTVINNLAQPALEQINKLNNAWVSDDEQAGQILKGLFQLYNASDSVFVQIALEDLEGVGKVLSQNGISAVFKEVPIPNAGYGWVLECDSIASFPVNIFGLYAPGGRIIYTPTEEEDDSAATTSRPSYTAPSTNVDIEYTQIFDYTTNTWVQVENTIYDNDVTNNTTNNNHYWDVDNRQFWDVENNTYTTYNSLTYNPSTQTYNVQFSDNRSYTYQFYYDYTYITYIGSSAEYREAYKVYYELPDGRSSGDLTVDDLKGISLQFDMINYDKVDSDTLTKVLLPFDGDLDNTAYQVDSSTGSVSSFLRQSGYSFLESPSPFGGSIFVPITNGGFTNPFWCTNWGNLSKGDSFTVQGRFYLDGTWTATDSLSLEQQFSVCVTYAGYWFSLFRIYGNTLVCDASRGPFGSYSTLVSSGVWYSFCFVYDGDLDRAAFWLNGDACIADTGSLFTSTPTTVAVTQSSLTTTSNPDWPSSAGSRFANMQVNGVGFFNGNSSSPVRVDNLRLVSHPLYTTTKIKVPQAPFDTNLVYVLPSVADLNDNTVAIMSQLPVTGYRVGGIRPTDPSLAAGYVWMHIDGDFVDSVQQWNGAYWEEVTVRLYTGVRWIPVTAFNVFTLEDMFDIVDPDGDGGGESVSTIYQYYLWWSGEWGTFQQWLQGTMETLIEAIQNSGSGGSGGPVVIVPGYNDQTTTNEITTENLDGSTTVTTIVSNAAGLVYSRSVTTWPPDAEGNVSSIEIYTDSSGVSFRTEIQVDKDGHVTIIDPSEATGTLGGFLTMIAQGVMSIATSVIQAFVDLLVEVVEFVLDSVSLIFAGIVNILASLLSALAGFGAQIGTAAEFIGAFYSILPAPIQAGFTLLFVGGVSLGLFRLIHF